MELLADTSGLGNYRKKETFPKAQEGLYNFVASQTIQKVLNGRKLGKNKIA